MRYLGREIKPWPGGLKLDGEYWLPRCYVQTYHTSGTPFSHELCEAYRSVAAAKRAIRAAARETASA